MSRPDEPHGALAARVQLRDVQEVRVTLGQLIRRFNPSEYPHRCECACCLEPFVDGDAVLDRWVAVDVTTPTHLGCVGLPLAPGHPFAEADDA